MLSILLLVASKCGHEPKKHVLIGCETSRVLPPNIWSLTAVKANCHAKGKLFICFGRRVPLIFHFSQLSGIFLAQKQRTCLQKLFLTSKNSWKEDFVEWKQIKSTTAAYSKLHMFGGKTCHVCTQLEHLFFLTRTHLDATNSKFPSFSFVYIFILLEKKTVIIIIPHL